MLKFIILLYKNILAGRLNIIESFEEVKWALNFKNKYGYIPFMSFEDPNDYPPDHFIEVKPKEYRLAVICHRQKT